MITPSYSPFFFTGSDCNALRPLLHLSPSPSTSSHYCSTDLLISLSQLLRGSAYDRLHWTFQLYDVNGDGCITKSELTDIVSSVHELMGRTSGTRSDDLEGATGGV
ncbi:Kv channel-interacting protein 2, partial [Armadillidium vulgare]